MQIADADVKGVKCGEISYRVHGPSLLCSNAHNFNRNCITFL